MITKHNIPSAVLITVMAIAAASILLPNFVGAEASDRSGSDRQRSVAADDVAEPTEGVPNDEQSAEGVPDEVINEAPVVEPEVAVAAERAMEETALAQMVLVSDRNQQPTRYPDDVLGEVVIWPGDVSDDIAFLTEELCRECLMNISIADQSFIVNAQSVLYTQVLVQLDEGVVASVVLPSAAPGEAPPSPEETVEMALAFVNAFGSAR